MKIYIAGKMTGLSIVDVAANFLHAESKIEDEGHEALNPARNNTIGLDHHEQMKICMPMVEEADGIYMLDNWKDSKGAAMELSYAIKLEKHLIFEIANHTID